jgi:hypothetical protein
VALRLERFAPEEALHKNSKAEPRFIGIGDYAAALAASIPVELFGRDFDRSHARSSDYLEASCRAA